MTQPEPVPFSGVPADIAPVRLPRSGLVFERRARRFVDLASGHSAGDWLTALGHLCEAQALAVGSVVPRSPSGGVRPLYPETWRNEADWVPALQTILESVKGISLPQPAREAIASLEKSRPETVVAFGQCILGRDGAPPAAAAAPFVAAALQACWTMAAGKLDTPTLVVDGSDCPVCGFPPIAGCIGGDDKVRYLCCSLCASEWHLPRVQCGMCRSAARLSYLQIEGDPKGIKAETCDSCRTYLKLFYKEALPAAEPEADDAASLALDLLVAEKGLSKAGSNLLVTPMW
jgi:FdhE protein